MLLSFNFRLLYFPLLIRYYHSPITYYLSCFKVFFSRNCQILLAALAGTYLASVGVFFSPKIFWLWAILCRDISANCLLDATIGALMDGFDPFEPLGPYCNPSRHSPYEQPVEHINSTPQRLQQGGKNSFNVKFGLFASAAQTDKHSHYRQSKGHKS